MRKVKQSAGILMYRKTKRGTELFLVHPGGPYWKNKDEGAWSIPKGEINEGESLEETARREFREETGQHVAGELKALSPVTQSGGKIVHAFAVHGDLQAGDIRSNTFEMEWPPHSGTKKEFPEVDRGAWFTWLEARTKILRAQLPLIDELEKMLEAASKK